MNEIIPFEFEKRQVRTVVIDGEPWFVAKDVAEVLGYVDTRDAVRRHCKRAQPVGGGVSPLLDQQTVIIPEADIYRLVMRSKLQKAERFEEWVCSVVLPTIRKTGQYSVAPPLTVEEQLAQAVMLSQQVIAKVTKERDEAVRTKAWISDKKTASAMGTAGAAVKKLEREKEINRILTLKEDERKKYVTYKMGHIGKKCAYCHAKIQRGAYVFAIPKRWDESVVHQRCLEPHLDITVKKGPVYAPHHPV